MSALEAMQDVRFVTAQGKRFAVVNAAQWEAVVAWLEKSESVRIERPISSPIDEGLKRELQKQLRQSSGKGGA